MLRLEKIFSLEEDVIPSLPPYIQVTQRNSFEGEDEVCLIIDCLSFSLPLASCSSPSSPSSSSSSFSSSSSSSSSCLLPLASSSNNPVPLLPLSPSDPRGRIPAGNDDL